MRAVVTGLGAVSPVATGVEQHWSGVLEGRGAIGPITRFDASAYPVRAAGEITDFDAAEHVSGRLIPQTDRVTRLTLAAADWALAAAGVDMRERDPFDTSVVLANSIGGFEFGQKELENLWGSGPDHVSAYQSFAWFYAVNTGQVSIRHGMRGPVSVVVSDNAGGLDALGKARRNIRRGTGLVVSGGMEAPLCPWGVAALSADPGLSRATDPERAFLPFSAEAGGYVMGEGGAVLVVESEQGARDRGARPLGEIAGHHQTFDPAPESGRGTRLEAAVRGALADAGLEPGAIDAVYADASGVPEADREESRALEAVFGARGVPVTAPKTMTGRLNSGGGALDAAMALLSIRDGVLPPTAKGVAAAEEHALDLVTGQPRELEVRNVLVLARGHGGFNSAMVLTKSGR
ncbi:MULTISPECIES: ketosynthase chain-length factor [unclassified Nocardiopsis]|uniref:ketosynthase chain-length factor n=1 Tax=Nocardiopsis TaxID=2013 RepID=UPI00387B8C79